MISQNRYLPLFFATVLNISLAPLAVHAATSRPQAPTAICVDNHCPGNTPSVRSGVKWHPGHYIWVSGPGWKSALQTTTFGVLDSTAKDSNVAGIQTILFWKNLEGDKAGDYAAGFALIDSILAKLASLPVPKRLIISVQERTFGTAGGTLPSGVYPQYIANMANGVAVAPKSPRWSGALTSVARLDNPAVMDRLIALSQAYGARYNSHSLVEMYVPMSELAIAGDAGLDPSAYVTQVQRLYKASATAWPNTLLRWQFNFAPADPADKTMLSLIAAARALPQSIIGGPDPEVPLPLPSDYPANVRTIQGNRIFRGLKQTSTTTAAQSYEDLRGKIPWVGEYQGAPRTGAGDVLPADFGNYEINLMHASHIVYLYNTWLPANTPSTDPHKWSAQLAYIDSTGGATYAGATPGGP
jgi:hypothetical protein